jgi:hypothetical protein
MHIKSDAELARMLGLSRAAVSTLKKRGMPTHDLTAARAWRDEHLSTAHRKDKNPARNHDQRLQDRSAAALVKAATDLGLLAHGMLEGGTADPVLQRLRTAMAAVPEQHQGEVALSVEVWDALTAGVGAELAAGGVPAGEAAPAMTEAQAQTMGGFWYAAATGGQLPAALTA